MDLITTKKLICKLSVPTIITAPLQSSIIQTAFAPLLLFTLSSQLSSTISALPLKMEHPNLFHNVIKPAGPKTHIPYQVALEAHLLSSIPPLVATQRQLLDFTLRASSLHQPSVPLTLTRHLTTPSPMVSLVPKHPPAFSLLPQFSLELPSPLLFIEISWKN